MERDLNTLKALGLNQPFVEFRNLLTEHALHAVTVRPRPDYVGEIWMHNTHGVLFWICVWTKPRSGQSRDYRDVTVFVTLRFHFFPSTLKRKAGVFKFLRFEEHFRKKSVSVIPVVCKQALHMGYSEIRFRIARDRPLALGITHTESLFAGFDCCGRN